MNVTVMLLHVYWTIATGLAKLIDYIRQHTLYVKQDLILIMKRILLLLSSLPELLSVPVSASEATLSFDSKSAYAQDDYYIKKAQSY